MFPMNRNCGSKGFSTGVGRGYRPRLAGQQQGPGLGQFDDEYHRPSIPSINFMERAGVRQRYPPPSPDMRVFRNSPLPGLKDPNRSDGFRVQMPPQRHNNQRPETSAAWYESNESEPPQKLFNPHSNQNWNQLPKVKPEPEPLLIDLVDDDDDEDECQVTAVMKSPTSSINQTDQHFIHAPEEPSQPQKTQTLGDPSPSSSSSSNGTNGHFSKTEKLQLKLKPPKCEVVLEFDSPDMRAYGTRIEQSIRDNLKISTSHSLFPVLHDAAMMVETVILRTLMNRGHTFAIIITEKNMVEECFKLIILSPNDLRQEFKDISYEEGVLKMRETLKKIQDRSNFTMVPLSILLAFKAMVQGAFLSDAEYQRAIKYISNRWEQQRKYEGRTEFEPGIDDFSGTGLLSDAQMEEKIMKILDKSFGGGENKEENLEDTASESSICHKIGVEMKRLCKLAVRDIKERQEAAEVLQDLAKTTPAPPKHPPPPPPIVGPLNNINTNNNEAEPQMIVENGVTTTETDKTQPEARAAAIELVGQEKEEEKNPGVAADSDIMIID